MCVCSKTLSPELVAAVSAAAATLPNQSQAESELLKKLRQHEAIGEAQKNGDVNNIGQASSHLLLLALIWHLSAIFEGFNSQGL